MCDTKCIYGKKWDISKRLTPDGEWERLVHLCCICSDIPSYLWCDGCVDEYVLHLRPIDLPDHVDSYLDTRWFAIIEAEEDKQPDPPQFNSKWLSSFVTWAKEE